MIIIGFIGKKGSGKDTAAECVRTALSGASLHLNGRPMLKAAFRRVAFADALKREIADGARLSVDYINRNKGAFRLILQGWGTEFRRNLCGEDYWVNQLDRELLRIKGVMVNAPLVVCVTDVRFKNEAALVRRWGGVLVRVTRPEGVKKEIRASSLRLLPGRWDSQACLRVWAAWRGLRGLPGILAAEKAAAAPERHVSEMELDGAEVDFTITNDGTLHDLHREVAEALLRILKN